MYYLNRIEDYKYFITDSSDNVEECFSKWQLIVFIRDYGLDILGCRVIHDTLIIDKVYKKNNLYVYCLEHGLDNIITEYCDKTIDFCRLSISSNRKVQWKCSICNGLWVQSPNIRFKRGKYGCPYCSGAKVLIGYNDIATTHPYLLDLWDYSANLSKPQDFSAGSIQIINWKCNVCSCKFRSPISTMTRLERKGLGCPDCAASRNSRGTSYNEQYILNFLSQFYHCKNRVHFNTFEFDIYIEELNILIEYDGEYWHSDLLKVKRDLKKNEIAMSIGCSLIRVREGSLPALDNCINIFMKDYNNLIHDVCIKLLDILTNR